MTKTGIEWTDETWNPVTGCTKVSAGCKHCYAERQWPRLAAHGQPYEGRAFTDVQCHPARLAQPLRWKKPRRVFVNSMSDLFHESVSFEFIVHVFAVMALAQHHTFQILTKRPRRMLDFFTTTNFNQENAEKGRARSSRSGRYIAAQVMARCAGYDAGRNHRHLERVRGVEMSTTVLDALRNARINLAEAGRLPPTYPQIVIGLSQLDNAIHALESGKVPHDIIQEEMLGDVDTGG